MSEHELWNELGNLYCLSGSYQQAIHAYTRAIALDRNFGHPYGNMAQAYERLGRYAEAIELYQRSIRLLVDEREKAVCWHRLGDVHRHLKDYPRAVEAYQQADEFDPNAHEGIEAGVPILALLSRKPTDEDLTQLVEETSPEEKIEEPAPASAPGMELLPFIEELTPWWFEGQTVPEDDPASDFDLEPMEATALVSPSEKISAGAEPAMQTVQPEVREPPVEETPAAEPDPVIVITDAPVIITDVPEYSAHDIAGPEPIRYETTTESSMVELSPEEQAPIRDEITKFKRMLEINPRNAIAWYKLGGQHKALGQYDEAVNAFQRAVSLDSSKASYFHQLGLMYAAVGRYEDALASFERVIAVDPNHSLAHAALGGYYRKNGKEELAQAHIEKARGLLAMDENEYNRACLEAICGNSERALDLLEIALKNKRTYVNWARRDPDLDFVRNDPRFHALLAAYATQPA